MPFNKKKHKNFTISEPANFYHRYHTRVDRSDLSLTGLPPQWKNEYIKQGKGSVDSFDIPIQYDFTLARTAKSDISLTKTTAPENTSLNDDVKKFVEKFNSNKMHMAQPSKYSNNITGKEKKDNYDVFFSFENEDQLVTIKVYKFECAKSDHEDELRFLSQADHKNIACLLEAFFWHQNVYLVFKDEQDISLYDAINFFGASFASSLSNISNPFSPKIIAYIAANIVDGLIYVHKLKYIHRDIKSHNILISQHGIPRISEFGVCIYAENRLSGRKGSLNWMAPEMIADKPYYTEVDVWSFGCTVLELCNGRPFLPDLEPDAVIEKIATINPREMYPNDVESLLGPFGKPFLKCCLAFKPVERASAFQLSTHPFLNSLADSNDLVELIFKSSLK